MKIALLDPSLRDHEGNQSINLGDLLIHESVARYLEAIFPDGEVARISTHTFLEPRHYEIIRQSDLAVIGGTNILSSDIRTYHQWKLTADKLGLIFPKVRNILLFGVGWWQYQDAPTFVTRHFYKTVLSRTMLHSVRDSYTEKMLRTMGIENVVNTSCPTVWELDGLDTNRKDLSCEGCVFSLTDYNRDESADTMLVDMILRHYKGPVYFFPQGDHDRVYLDSLDIYQKNRERITLLDHSIDTFHEVIGRKGVNYIGTRLHGGTTCLRNGIDTVIISIDNRSEEIARDIRLPVIPRSKIETVERWIQGDRIFEPIRLPLEGIERWKRQFLQG